MEWWHFPGIDELIVFSEPMPTNADELWSEDSISFFKKKIADAEQVRMITMATYGSVREVDLVSTNPLWFQLAVLYKHSKRQPKLLDYNPNITFTFVELSLQNLPVAVAMATLGDTIRPMIINCKTWWHS